MDLGRAPPPPLHRDEAFFFVLGRVPFFVDLTSQLHHSLVVHPLLRKTPGSAWVLFTNVCVLHEIIQKIPVQLRNLPRGISL